MPHYRIASVVALVCLLAPPTLVASSAQVVELDSTTLDRRYDGFGGLSGGGATSRLLPDYPDPQRGEVLDLLFKPFWGASLHMLKVEIGGATFSGCGTEPTHALNATDLNLHRGYEWWLAREASARNPSVLGYALSWGFPHWIGAQNGGRPLTPQQAAYTASFCAGASSVAGAWGCDFVGVWNERDWSSDYIIELRAALDAANLSATRVVVADGGWDPVAALAANDTLRAAVYAVGVHYPSGSNSTPAAVALDLPLWASEDSSTYFDASGGGCLTRILSWNVIYGSMTSTVIWNLVSSYYDHLRWYGDSLMAASSPWSGSYADAAPLWSAAHWTQFAWPGWTFLPVARAHGGRGGAGELPGGGTYVTLVDTTGTSEVVEAGVLAAVAAAAARGDPPPSRADLAALRRSLHELTLATGEAFVPPTRARAGGVPPRPRPSTPLHWTLILETTTAPHSQCIRSNPARAWDVAAEQNITFVLDSGLQLPSAVVAWKTVHFTSAGERGVSWFQRLPDIPVDVGSRSFTVVGLHPDTALTVASVDRGQRHGAPPAPPPPRAPFPSPYADDFAETPIDGMPRYFSDHAGSWAARPRRDGAPRSAYEQLVTEQPVGWDDNADDSLYPFTIIGDWNASDADIGADAYVADYATYHPGGGGGDPLVSLAPCVAGDAAQMWVLNASAAIALPGSVIAHDSGQCLDVDGCATPPGTPLWMWPCVTSAPGTNCESKNQVRGRRFGAAARERERGDTLAWEWCRAPTRSHPPNPPPSPPPPAGSAVGPGRHHRTPRHAHGHRILPDRRRRGRECGRRHAAVRRGTARVAGLHSRRRVGVAARWWRRRRVMSAEPPAAARALGRRHARRLGAAPRGDDRTQHSGGSVREHVVRLRSARVTAAPTQRSSNTPRPSTHPRY